MYGHIILPGQGAREANDVEEKNYKKHG